ncbi:MAG: nucleotidyl transferase AbiEii/AbiGii toxin family protein [Alphaproteobacteria bacterium]|nr:nucleotidyl transferase AbiEii/AbiGii toxin family protein [Alphaproteobacteria bacterium]
MLSTNDLRKIAARSGARDIGNVEIDVILTYLLQLFSERGLSEHLAFKGGTMLRKMVFGPRGRLSTDLDFTRRTDISLDDLMMMMLKALNEPYQGLSFHYEKDKDWYLTDDGCAANPVCRHADNDRGVKIKLQVSTRERPILPVSAQPQLDQDYFRLLPFRPADIPSLALNEVIAEKIRAASQRSKIRDLHDLSEIGTRALDKDTIRPLAALKLWNSRGPGLDYAALRARIERGDDYDIDDLKNLLRKDEQPDLKAMIDRTVNAFQFLANLTETEKIIAADRAGQKQADADALIATLARN